VHIRWRSGTKGNVITRLVKPSPSGLISMQGEIYGDAVVTSLTKDSIMAIFIKIHLRIYGKVNKEENHYNG
tara:strand:- start:285 stop:497 length:213 start_codon:yes stop_codon:yes gene_type:complete